MNLTSTLRRVPRHMSFVHDTSMRQCFWNPIFQAGESEECNFIQQMNICHLFVFKFNYLKIIFCGFHLESDDFTKYHMTTLAAMLIVLLLSLNYVIAKYFFLPNFLTLLKRMPISAYVYGYIFFSLFFFSATYTDALLSCQFQHEYQATLVFIRGMGSALVLLIAGVVQLCYVYYRVEGTIFWCNMLVIIFGYCYLLALVRRKMKLYNRMNSPDRSFRLDFRARWLLLAVIIYCFLVVFVSYWYERHKRQKAATVEDENKSVATSEQIELNELQEHVQPSSDEHIKVHAAAETELTGFQLWLNTVNGLAHMRDLPKWCRVLAAPFFFIIANFVPVVDEARPLQGWCKFVVCTSIMMYPIVLIPLTITSEAIMSLIVAGLCISLLICHMTTARRRPNFSIVFTVLGLLMSSVLLQYTVAECYAIAWQFLMFYYNWPPDMIAVLCFNIANVFTQFVVVMLLVRRGYYDTAYGVIVGMVTINIYMLLPTLVLHDCYTSRSYIAITSYAETTNIFTVLIMVCITLGVSTCGYEFRPMFAIYLVLLMLIYYTYQVLCLFEVIHPFGTHHTPNVPLEKQTDWA